MCRHAAIMESIAKLFAANEFMEVSLNQWLRALPVQAAMAHKGLSAEELGKVPAWAEEIVG